MNHQAIGEATSMESNTNFKKSLDNKPLIDTILAPSTLRIPISLVRCSIVNAANPEQPHGGQDNSDHRENAKHGSQSIFSFILGIEGVIQKCISKRRILVIFFYISFALHPSNVGKIGVLWFYFGKQASNHLALVQKREVSGAMHPKTKRFYWVFQGSRS